MLAAGIVGKIGTVTRHRRRERVLAACLAMLAGYIDALGFLKLGGFFVSFMSGNSTRLGVGLSSGWAAATLPALLIGLFVTGVVAGSLVGRAAVTSARRRPAVLGFVTLLLAGAAILEETGLGYGAVAAMTLAMGAENALFERDGEVSIGLTYMTGTLVKLGQRITDALLGGNRWSWIWYLLLWSGLVTGALTGAAVYERMGLGGLWIAAPVAALFTVAAGMIGDERR